MKQKNDYSINTVLANNTKPVIASNELSNEVKELLKAGEFFGRYKGKDNNGKPKTDFLQKLVNSTDEQLFEEGDSYIWLSAYASNNPRSDYHWMCDAVYDECQRRNKPDIYTKAHKRASSK